MNKFSIRIVLLVLLVMLGLTRTVLTYFNSKSELITSSSASPQVNVFTNKNFFLKIRLFFIYDVQKIEIDLRSIINSAGSDIYSGKMKYNIFYMTNEFTKELVGSSIQLYLCDKKSSIDSLLQYRNPDSVEIQYENRSEGKSVKNVKFACH